ncbi:MAG: cytidylate kinase-like family protein [Acidaminococcaceae bacterium]|jgi:cytidylate kinase|nr:cytidylate kinase-like family protein [Acidaminococcaceae bacterium]
MNKIITISREYGSGGRTIGEEVAKRLGFAFYNHNMIDLIAHKSGLDKGYIENWEQQVSSPSIWDNLFVQSRGVFSRDVSSSYYYNMGKMFVVQSQIIREAAQKSSCVFVGRCADYILRDYEHSIHILIYADEKLRLERVTTEYNEKDAFQLLERVDQGRRNYYNQFTNQIWGDYHNYDLMLDSGSLGIKKCVDLIVAAQAEKKEEKR